VRLAGPRADVILGLEEDGLHAPQGKLEQDRATDDATADHDSLGLLDDASSARDHGPTVGGQTYDVKVTGKGGPRLAFSTLGCPEWDAETVVEQAAAGGWDGVEWRGGPDGTVRSAWPA